MVTGTDIKPPKVIEFPIEDTFVHEYLLHRAGTKSKTVEVSVPQDFIKRLARVAEIPLQDYIKRCKAVVYYGGGNRLLYEFELKDESRLGSK